VALNDDEFVSFLNYDMPIQVQMSPDYVTKLACKVPDSICEDSKPYYLQFQSWWAQQKAAQKTELFEKLKMNGNTTYNRELEILSRRFKGWNKTDNLKVDQETKVSGSVSINFIPRR
jgi:5-methylcytosine-specific restriction endonuclease McrBC GTP-binding regulatory subunit McrB